MLNNRAIAKTVVEVIRACDDRPISIGIHGDWGAGKSSILAMVEDEFSKSENGCVCIRFNGWKHQGFEDAKIALMSAIVSELSENETVKSKAKGALKKLWKNINWLSVAKTVGSSVFSIATGMPPLGLLSNVLDTLKGAASDGDKVASTVDAVGKYMTDAKVFEDTSLSKEFSEFQKAFEILLEVSKITKLVILIDDLDRCLPKVTIETLEAVRLFMFTKSTAFVIAADEAMIQYAVQNHFPNLPQTAGTSGYDYSQRYLEKLIQVPFKIPALGEIESEMYITLLMIGSKIKDSNAEFSALLANAIEKMKKPWENTGFSLEELRTALDTQYSTVGDEISVAHQISDILAKNTQGNPRKIKRFLNMLLLRKQMAEARGFGTDIQIPMLAKLMLAEYWFPEQYKEIATLTDDTGKCSLLSEFERVLTESPPIAKEEDDHEKIAIAVSRGEASTIPEKKDERLEKWKRAKNFSLWVSSEPKLGDIDLRPYFFASKEREDFFFDQIKSDQLRELISKLMGGTMSVATATDDIKKLNSEEARHVFTLLEIKIKKASDISKQPSGIDGMRALVAQHSELEESLLGFIESYIAKTVGVWICNGWGECLKSDTAKSRYTAYLKKLQSEGTGLTKAAAKAALK
jgi:hypothetical protein